MPLALRLLNEFDNIVIRHMPKEMNFEANELAQLTSRYKINASTLKKLIELKGCCVSVKEREVYLLGQLNPSNCRKPIVEFLKDLNVAVDKKIKIKALNYVMLGDSWCRKSADGNLLTCLGESETYIALA